MVKNAVVGVGISVLGNGLMGRALSQCLLRGGYQVHLGSRDPESARSRKWDTNLEGAINIVSIKEAIQANNVVFMCLHFEHVESLQKFKQDFSGKIIVDVSNRMTGKQGKNQISNAEQMQEWFDSSIVVKAFNTWPSHSLLNRYLLNNKDVHVASNDGSAVDIIAKIIQRMCFNPVTHPGLEYSRELENRAKGSVKNWKCPLILVAILFLACFIYAALRFHVVKQRPLTRLPLHTMNKICGTVSLTTLSLVYLPWNIAAITQLCTKSSAKPFPAYLDTWLKMRRELGLLAMWFACVHGVTSLALSRAYLSTFYPKWSLTIPSNHTENIILVPPTQTWQGELTFLLGALALGFFAIPTITSLPSVQATLNQDQWHVAQSVLGQVSLFIATAHTATKSSPTWFQIPFTSLIQKLSILSLILPIVTLLCRVIMLTPCISRKLNSIRRGILLEERKSLNGTVV